MSAIATGSGEPVDLSVSVVGLDRTGGSVVLPVGHGPTPSVDGYSVGAPYMTRNPPHNGELHPDGDELLFVISGRVHVILEETEGERTVAVGANQAFVVPRGIWHRVVLQEPTHLLHITPGPGGDHRPLS